MELRLLSLLLVALLLPRSVFAQKKPPEKKPKPPKVLMTTPLCLKVGAKTRLTIRGVDLDQCKSVHFADKAASVKFIKASKAGIPEQNLKNKLGDTQVVIEVDINPKFTGNEVAFTVKTSSLESKPHSMLVGKASDFIKEKEPNEAFDRPQQINLPATLDGSIERRQDVDVFAFTGKAGKRVIIDLQAARRGSPLDGLLTLYDDDGNLVASSLGDDKSVDPKIEAVLPKDGTFYISVIDAHDFGTRLHLYRLVATMQ